MVNRLKGRQIDAHANNTSIIHACKQHDINTIAEHSQFQHLTFNYTWHCFAKKC